MKKRNKIISLLLLLGLCMGMTSTPVSAATKYGFTYDTSEYNVSWKTMNSFTVCSEYGGVLGTCSYVVGLTRDKGTNDYVLMTREVMTPNKKKVKIDVLIGEWGYGFSEYVSTKVTLPTLDDYEPKNTPTSDTIEFSIGGDSSGPNVGASYSITDSDLDITASCNTPSKLYYVKYDYKPNIVLPFQKNKYLANESVQLGAAAFHSSAKTISFTMKYDARFGAAGNSTATSWQIYIDYVKKQQLQKVIVLP